MTARQKNNALPFLLLKTTLNSCIYHFVQLSPLLAATVDFWAYWKNVRVVKLSCCQHHISSPPFPCQRSESWPVSRSTRSYAANKNAFWLTKQVSLVFTVERECLEAGSCKHGTTSPIGHVLLPTEKKSEMIWPLAHNPVKTKGQLLAAATDKSEPCSGIIHRLERHIDHAQH